MGQPITMIDARVNPPPREDLRGVPLEELDRRVRAAAEVWETLLDECTAGGMLPSPPLASLLVSFLERDYWVAEEAWIEGLRRRALSDRTRTHHPHAQGNSSDDH